MLRGRGPESEWVDSKCPVCGAYYFGAALEYAQAMHDRNENCAGRLTRLRADAEQQQALGEQETPRRSSLDC
jgi:hypothetical protein